MDTPTNIDESLRLRLGTLIIEWSFVDAICGEFLAYMLKADPGAVYVVTQNVSSGTIGAWLRTLAPVRFLNENTRERLADLFGRIDDIRSDRNALVHGIWKAGDETGTAIVQTIGWHRSSVVKEELVTIADLNDLIDGVRNVVEELEILAKKLGF